MNLKLVAAALAAAGMAAAQTQVNQSRQTKNDNFSGAGFVIPFPTGTALPALCTTGSMFFNSGAPAGSNLYGCPAANTWVLEGGCSGGSTLSGLLSAQETSGTVVTIGGTCTMGDPCLVELGSNVYSYANSAAVTLTGGSGTVYLYVDVNGNVTAGESASGSPSLTCSECVLASSITQFPPGTIPLATWPAVSGAWSSGISDVALQRGGPAFSAGSNISLTQSGNSVTIAASLESLPNGPQPACAAATGGYMWYIPGASGVADLVQVCAKDSTNAYAWRTLY